MSEAKQSKQSQKSGNSSVNIQANQITVGLSYDNVKTIAQTIFDANFYKLSEIAGEMAKDRADKILNQFLTELKEKNPEGLSISQDPDFQYSLFNVQKAYARTGDKDLGDILVNILVDRTKETNRNIKQIVLNESLETAPKLTKSQYSALSVIFIFKYTRYTGMVSLDEFPKYFDHLVSPFIPSLVKNTTCYQHLEYAGCGTIGIGSSSLEKILLNHYPGIFVKGFNREDINELLEKEPRLSQFIRPSLRDPNLLQINATDEPTVRQNAIPLGIESSAIDKLIAVQKTHMMNDKEVKDYSISAHPCVRDLYDVWDNSHMKNLTLTSVGIAIGHANIRRLVGDEFDLSIWINE